jgi:uncharacterized Fe-S center protein
MKPGEDVFLGLNKKPYWIQVEEAERLGLGRSEYELVEV